MRKKAAAFARFCAKARLLCGRNEEECGGEMRAEEVRKVRLGGIRAREKERKGRVKNAKNFYCEQANIIAATYSAPRNAPCRREVRRNMSMGSTSAAARASANQSV